MNEYLNTGDSLPAFRRFQWNIRKWENEISLLASDGISLIFFSAQFAFSYPTVDILAALNLFFFISTQEKQQQKTFCFKSTSVNAKLRN